MKGFVVYPTYKIEDEKADIYLFGRLENNESFLAKIPYRPYFFIKKTDLKKATALGNFKHKESELKDFDENPVVKILLDIPGQVPELRKKFEEAGIECLEADIKFAYRFLIDHGIRGSIEIEGEYEKGERIDRIYDDPKIKSSDFVPELKILCLDIETDRHANELYCVSIVCNNYKKVFIVSDEQLKNAEIFSNEKTLLIKLKEKILELDPDIITGWNLIDFDLDIIRKKFQKYKLDFDFGRINWPSKIKIEERFFIDSKADFPGRMVLDGIHLLKTSFIGLDDYKLDTAAEKFLGEKKLIDFKNKGIDLENLYKSERQKLVDYNLKDSELVIGIIEKTGVVKLTILRTLLTGMALDRVRATIASFDSLYLFYLREEGYAAKTSDYSDREGRAKGGFVMESKPGIYDNIAVLDFKSLYPSIIRTYNIDPLTFARGKKEENPIVAANGAKFGRENGLLPRIIENLWKQRDAAKKRKDALASNAIKILMNSFYGALANPTCRFFSLELANAITHTGQYTIKTTGKEIERMGYEVIYGDTDSIFVNIKKETEESQKTAQEIKDKINKFWEEKLKKDIGRKSFLELEFDKFFTRFFMPKTRHEETGSKKRYAGLKLVDGKEQLSFTGLETVRRDWTDLAKKFQQELFMLIFRKKDVKEYMKKTVKELREGKYDDLLVYRRSISKNLDEYVKTTPPHVKAARQLDELKSNIIEYYMTTNGPEPIEKRRGKINYEHYIEKQLKPIADTIISFIGEDFDKITAGKGQRNLGDY